MLKEIKSKPSFGDNFTDYSAIGIVLMVICFGFLYHVFAGILFLILAGWIYSKCVYSVVFNEHYICQNFLFKTVETPPSKADYLLIVNPRPTLTLSLSLKIKDSNKRINFSYGDKENLERILNYFNENKIRIVDERGLLKYYYQIDIKAEL
jgi:hypothetical protein